MTDLFSQDFNMQEINNETKNKRNDDQQELNTNNDTSTSDSPKKRKSPDYNQKQENVNNEPQHKRRRTDEKLYKQQTAPIPSNSEISNYYYKSSTLININDRSHLTTAEEDSPTHQRNLYNKFDYSTFDKHISPDDETSKFSPILHRNNYNYFDDLKTNAIRKISYSSIIKETKAQSGLSQIPRNETKNNKSSKDKKNIKNDNNSSSNQNDSKNNKPCETQEKDKNGTKKSESTEKQLKEQTNNSNILNDNSPQNNTTSNQKGKSTVKDILSELFDEDDEEKESSVADIFFGKNNSSYGKKSTKNKQENDSKTDDTSTNWSTHAKKIFDEDDIPLAETTSFGGFTTAKTAKTKQTETSQIEPNPSNNQEFQGFTTANGKQVSINRSSLNHVKKLFGGDNEESSLLNTFQPSSTYNNEENHSTQLQNKSYLDVNSGFTTGKGRKIKTKKFSEDHFKKLFEGDQGLPTLATDTNSDNNRNHNILGSEPNSKYSGFQTGNGNKLSPKQSTLDHAKLLFGDEDTATIQPNMSNNNSLLSTTKYPGFQTGTGKKVNVSKSSLDRVKNLFGTDDVSAGKDTETYPQENSLSEFCGFKKGTGKPIKSNNNTTEHVKKLFGDEESDDFSKFLFPQKNDKQNDDTNTNQCNLNKDSESNTYGGFSTGKGNPVSINNSKIDPTQLLFGDANNKEQQPSDFDGFKKGTGNPVKTKQTSQEHFKKLFQDGDDDLNSLFSSANKSETDKSSSGIDMDSFGGFSTGNGKSVSISKTNLDHARLLFGNDDENSKSNNQNSDELSTPKSKTDSKKLTKQSKSMSSSSSLGQLYECTNPDSFSPTSYQTPKKQSTKIPKSNSAPPMRKTEHLSHCRPLSAKASIKKKTQSKGFKVPRRKSNTLHTPSSTSSEKQTKIRPNSAPSSIKNRKTDSNIKIPEWMPKTQKGNITMSKYLGIPKRNDLVNTQRKKMLWSITSTTAQQFKFSQSDACFQFQELMKLAEDSKLENKQIGFSEMRNIMIYLGGVAHFLSEEWVENHYRWIMWKLAALERQFERYKNRFTPEQVLSQLIFRYQYEYVEGHRPILRKITEGDDTPARVMNLLVADTHIENGSETDRSQFIELSDGWYSILAQIDEPLANYVEQKKIFSGQKLRICNSDLEGSDRGSPLELNKTAVFLKIHANCVRRAKWNAKLGLVPKSAIKVNIASINIEGGRIPFIEGIVVRRYPMLYMERIEEGDNIRRIVRSSAAERIAKNKFEKRLEKFQERMQNKFKKEAEQEMNTPTRKRKPSLAKTSTDGRVLYDLMITSPDPMFAQQLSPKQQEALVNYKNSLQQSTQDDMAKQMQQAIEENNMKRNVSQLFTIKLQDACPYKKRGDEISKSDRTCLITVWCKNSEQYSALNEGSRVQLFGLTPSPFSKIKKYKSLNLNKWQVNIVERKVKNFEKRKPLPIAHLYDKVEINDDVDLVALILAITGPEEQSTMSGKTYQEYCVFIVDRSNALAVINIREFEDKELKLRQHISEGKILCFSNVILDHCAESTVSLSACDMSVFTPEPKSTHYKEAFQSLSEYIQQNPDFYFTWNKHVNSLRQGTPALLLNQNTTPVGTPYYRTPGKSSLSSSSSNSNSTSILNTAKTQFNSNPIPFNVNMNDVSINSNDSQAQHFEQCQQHHQKQQETNVIEILCNLLMSNDNPGFVSISSKESGTQLTTYHLNPKTCPHSITAEVRNRMVDEDVDLDLVLEEPSLKLYANAHAENSDFRIGLSENIIKLLLNRTFNHDKEVPKWLQQLIETGMLTEGSPNTSPLRQHIFEQRKKIMQEKDNLFQRVQHLLLYISILDTSQEQEQLNNVNMLVNIQESPYWVQHAVESQKVFWIFSDEWKTLCQHLIDLFCNPLLSIKLREDEALDIHCVECCEQLEDFLQALPSQLSDF